MQTKNNFLTGMCVIFFFTKDQAKELNNGSQIAAAIVVSRPWSDRLLNLSIVTDGHQIVHRTSVHIATSLAMALNGNCFATHSAALGWGIDLSDAAQDINKLLEDAVEASSNQSEAAEQLLKEKTQLPTETRVDQTNVDSPNALEGQHESGKSTEPVE